MPRYYKKRIKRAGYGTRYYSTRKYPGLYRSSSKYNVTGRALRRLGRYKLRQAIKSIAERKFYDNQIGQTSAGNNLNDAGFLYALSDMTQGAGQSQRIGDKCTGSSLEWRGVCFSPALVTTVPYITVRVIIFVWRDDTTPVLADIIEDVTNPTLSPLAHDTKIKRKVLFEKTWTQYLDPTNKTVTIPNQLVKAVIPLNKMKYNIVNFQGGTTIAVNHIYFLSVSNTPNGTPNTEWNFGHYFRYSFIDM